ncbi:uncharacterized protein LOC117533235 [Gymnodraco acuticeps]|uniref:Uncharacterized protein LOC117533235 n=1 Tax=Gymnodraco acuticeps TaxID=8218 RepID=A0A6P8SPV0_GYMAC|nr:uncharacterized protein LOC117533235 [Gymnodraco acuticeps]
MGALHNYVASVKANKRRRHVSTNHRSPDLQRRSDKEILDTALKTPVASWQPFAACLLPHGHLKDPVQRIQRWDKANKTYVEVERPYIVGTYNKYMGGVDPHEVPTLVRVHLLAHHPCCDQRLAPQARMQSSKDAKAGDPEQETVSGRSSILSHLGTGSPAPTVTSRSPLNAQKRPSSGDGSPPNGAPSKRSQPPLDVRKDLMAHFPVKTKRGHCSKGYTQCTKCDVRLCFSDDMNCFWDYLVFIFDK